MPDTPTIEHRQLGTGGPSVAAIGLGCMSLSGIYGAADDAASEELIRYAIDQGVDHLDSSDMYGWGHNEAGDRPRPEGHGATASCWPRNSARRRTRAARTAWTAAPSMSSPPARPA